MARWLIVFMLGAALLAVTEGRAAPPQHSGHSRDSHMSCHTRVPPSSEKKLVNHNLRAFHHRHRRALEDEPQLTIPIKFHIITSGSTGMVTEAQCAKQVEILNDAYGGRTDALGTDARIQFTLSSVTHYDNSNWYQSCDRYQSTFQEHAVDPTRYVNVFSCSGDGYLGWATFPDFYPEAYKSHNIIVADGTFPDGNASPYNKGDTLTHELGHFFGLLHTFSQSGTACTESGDDGVADTPMQASPSYDCDFSKDTCPSQPGNDPVWNFMDYTDDECMTRFSPLQVERMRDSLGLYKPLLVQHSQGSSPTTTTTTSQAPNPTTTTTTSQGPNPTTTTTTTTTTQPPPEPQECADGCLIGWEGDGYCDEACNVAACNFDLGDCDEPEPLCNEGCYQGWSGDGYCDDDCNVAACNFDEGDCASNECAPGCYAGWPGDNYCDDECYNEVCEWDLGDCGPAPEPSTTPASGLSAMSCSELGWGVRVAGIPVCGVSKPDGTCHKSNTLEEAEDICSSFSARLCTAEELRVGVALGTGCNLNKKYVWTGDACEEDASLGMIAPGSDRKSSFTSKPPTCASPSENYGVRCCADDF